MNCCLRPNEPFQIAKRTHRDETSSYAKLLYSFSTGELKHRQRLSGLGLADGKLKHPGNENPAALVNQMNLGSMTDVSREST